MSRTSWILGPLTAALVLGLTAGRSFGQEAVIIGPATVTPIATSAYPVSTVAPSVSYYSAPTPTVSYYAAPAPAVSYYAAPAPTVSYYSAPTPAVSYYAAPAPVVVSSYYAPAPVAYSPSEVVVRQGLFGRRVVRYYYGPPAYVYP